MSSLSHELQNRGHQVTVIGKLDSHSKAIDAGLDFAAIGEADFPLGSMANTFRERGALTGLAALQHTLRFVEHDMKIVLQDSPAIISAKGIEALLVDQCVPVGGTVADFLKIPFISICNALLMNREATIPPLFVPWNYHPSLLSYLRNQVGYTLASILVNPIRQLTNYYRQKWGLPLHQNSNDAYSRLAQLSQQPAEFEFPRKRLPPWFHFTGPYPSAIGRGTIPFPWERLTGQPLIFASMGTIQNQLIEIFQRIAEACDGLDAQLVISLGGGIQSELLPKLIGSPLIVDYAPQLELLKKATLTITHAGLNTVLESLANAVPMVAIPITNDQPGVSARIAWTGTGKVILPKQLTPLKLRAAIHSVLTDPTYKQNADRLQVAIQRSGGVKLAADIIETAIATGRPVTTLPNN